MAFESQGSVRALVVGYNETVRRRLRRTLEVLGAGTQGLAQLPGGLEEPERFGGHRPDLLVVDCSRADAAFWGRLEDCLESAGGTVPCLPVSLDVDSLPDTITLRHEVAAPLAKPFTPRQLCFAAFMVQPRLRPPGGQPPFPRAGEAVAPEEIASEAAFQGDQHPDMAQTQEREWGVDSIDSSGFEGSIFDDEPAPPPPDIESGEAPSHDIDIVDFEDVEPIPGWVEMFVGVLPVIAREGWSDVRARLVTATLAVEGVIDEPYWLYQEVAKGAADHIDFLGQAQGLQGDLSWLPPMEVFGLIRSKNAKGILEFEDAKMAIRLSVHGDRLYGLEPRDRVNRLRLGELLMGAGQIEEADLHEALSEQARGAGKVVGRILTDKGLINQESLEAALKRQARGYLQEVLSLTVGQYSFRDSAGEAEALPPTGGHSLTSLMLENILEEGAETPSWSGGATFKVDRWALENLAEDALGQGVRDGLLGLGPGASLLEAVAAMEGALTSPEAHLDALSRMGLAKIVEGKV